MVGILTSMKFAMLRHSPATMRRAGWVVGGVLVIITWVGHVRAADPEVRADVALLLFACWGVGAVMGPVSMSGAGVLRAEYFTLLPLSRSRLALGLLGAVFPGVASVYLLLAFLGVTVLAGYRSPALIPIAVLAAVLAWVVVITAARLLFAILGAAMGTRLGVEISALQFGFMIAGLFAGWMVVLQAAQTVPVLLEGGLPDGPVVTGLSMLPTSWPVLAIEAASVGAWPVTTGWILALLCLAAVFLVVAAFALRPRLGHRATRARRRPVGSRVLTGRSMLPDSPLGAVIGKELRQWWRDPWRALELRSAVYAGLAIGVLAFLSITYQALAPLSGLAIAFMLCVGGCNVYGQDGSAVWLSVVGERADTVGAEIRGRQIAMLMLFVPPAVVVSVLLVLITDEHWAWPVVLAGLPALFGAASGVAILCSVLGVSPGVDPRRRVGPNDAGGDLNLQGNLSVWSTIMLITPTAAALIVGFVSGAPWAPWAAIPIGVANGALAYLLLGRAAMVYLRTRLPTLFTRIRYGSLPDGSAGGLLGWVESRSQAAEEQARAQKEQEKADRARKRAAAR